MNRYILEFSKESEDAVTEILRSASYTDSAFSIISRAGNVAIVEGNLETIREMSFLNFASSFITTFNDISDLEGINLPEGTFHVRIRDHTGNAEFSESDIGKVLKGTREVTFRNPDFVVRAIHSDRWYLGIVVYEKDSKGINRRRAPLRPFFSPVTIHPKFARFLVNLSRTRPGDLILDPFCGTGGIILEAYFMGRKVIGSDASLSMVKGCRLNMKYFSAEAEVLNSDFIGLAFSEEIRAIVSDLPYGRSSELNSYGIDTLYAKAFPKFSELLATGGYVSIVVSDPELLRYSRDYFSEISVTPFRQHRSLTRYFVSMQKL